MKYLQRYLSLLFALVMCLSVFSITAHAEVLEMKPYNIYLNEVVGTRYGNTAFGSYTFSPGNDIQEVTDKSSMIYFSSATDNAIIFNTEYYVANNDKTSLFSGEQAVTVKLQNVRMYFLLTHPDNGTSISYTPDNVGLSSVIYYNDGSVDYVSGSVIQRSDGVFDFTLKFTPSKDVLKICFIQYSYIPFAELDTSVYKHISDSRYLTTIERLYGEVNGDTTFQVSIDQETKEESLLGGIWSSITSGFSELGNKISGLWDSLKSGFSDLGNKLTSGFTELGNKLTGIFDAIINLPNKLWELISNGLKSLFVPSEESMVAYKDKWDELLSSRFGAVYQVVNIMTDSWDGVINADETNTINFPSATINFSGTPFTFGGYEVKIVPEGFDVLVTAIKSIVGIVCTVAFVNGMRKRYDEIMGVES